jgi:murein DD-endopeptidase MepM/ murein hydrolase activator NlpD
LAPCDGTIKIIERQEQSGDYSVVIEPKVNPIFIFGNDWVIDLDHVKDIKVKKGDKVTAGQVIGKPGSDQGASWMFELDLVKRSDCNHYAPGKFFDSSVNTVIKEKLIPIMEGLEGDIGGRAVVYDYAAMLYPGCWMEKISENVYQPGGPYYPGYST